MHFYKGTLKNLLVALEMSQFEGSRSLTMISRRALSLGMLIAQWQTKKHRSSPLLALWIVPWWRHQMETFSMLLDLCAGNSPVTGEFPAQRPVTQSFEVFFDLHLNKQLSKQSWGWRVGKWWGFIILISPFLLFQVRCFSNIQDPVNMLKGKLQILQLIQSLQLSAVITQSQLSQYCTQHCNDSSRT